MRRTGANARPARAAKEPLRFAAEEKYATELPPSVQRGRAEREQADDDDDDDPVQPGAMTGEDFVKQEKKAAKAAGISSKRADAPIYDRDAEPEKVTLPPGWKPSSKKEVEKYFENLNTGETREMVRLHLYAFFSGGSFLCSSKDTAVKFIRDNGLVVGPWHKQGFPGMCCSKELAKQRQAKAAQEENDKRSDDATFDRLAGLGLSKEDLSHKGQYVSLACDDLVTEAFLRGVDVPKGSRQKQEKLVEWFPSKVGDCVDCGRRRQLLRIEHARGGEHDGARREPPCPGCNKGERASCDMAIHAAHEEGETLTEDGCEAVPKSHFTTFHDSLVDFYSGTPIF